MKNMWSQSARCKGCDFQITLNRCGGEGGHPYDSLVQLEQRRALMKCGAIYVAQSRGVKDAEQRAYAWA